MKYVLNKGVIKKARTKILSFSYAVILAATGLSGAAPLLFSQNAFALNPTVVTPANMNGWTQDMEAGGSYSFVTDGSAPLGSGALQLKTPNDNNAVAEFDHNVTPVLLSSLTNASFQTKQLSGPSYADASYALGVDLDGNGTLDTYLIYEPYWNGTVSTTSWQTWDLTSSTAKMWSTSTAGGLTAGHGGPPMYSLADVTALDPNAKVTAIATYIGSYNPAYTVLVDNLQFNGTTYDFEPATPPSAASQTTQVVTQPDLNFPNAWYYYDDNTDTPSTVNSSDMSIVANPSGIVSGDNGAVKLDGSNGRRSDVATLKYNGTPLTDIAKIGFSTYQPSSNGGTATESDFLNFDVDLNAGLSGYQGRLVYVPSTNGTVNQNQWQNWEGVASNGLWTWSHFYSNGNKWPDGSTTENRTWNDIVNSFPGAKVAGQLVVRAGNPDNHSFVGYTDHVYLATATDNVNYNFELQPPAAPTNLSWKTSTNVVIPNGGATNVYGGTAFWQASTSSNVDHYVYKYWNDIANNPYKPGHEYTANVNGTSLPGVFNQGEGVHHFCVEAVDTNGIPSACSTTFTITYDTTAPSTPTITAPSARQWFKTTPITDSWTTATDNLSGVKYYQIAYNYDDGHSFGGSTCTGLTMTGVSGFIGCRDVNGTSRGHVPGPSEQGGVTIWVRAIDNAGNVGAWSQSVHYYYDHTAPSTTITVSPVVNGVFTVSGTATDNLALNRVYVQLVNTDSQRYGGTTIDLITTPFSTSKTWSQTYDMHALGYPDGVYAADAAVTDMAGNTYDTGWTSDFTVDTTAPTAPSSASWEDSSNNVITGLTNINPIKPVWDASSSSDVAYYEYSYKAQNYGGNVWSSPGNYGLNTTTGLTSLGSVAGAEGDWQFRVRAVDHAGNVSVWTYSPVITFDRTAPSAPGAPTTTSPTSSLNSTWTWTAATDANGIKGYLFDLTDSSNNSVASYPTTTPSVPTSWLTSVATYGTYTFHVRAVDNAGNIGPESTGTVVVAAPAPEVLGDSTSNTNHVYINTSSSQNSNSGNSNNNGNTSGGNSQSGSSNNTDNTSSDVSINNSGNVKGDSTSKGSTPAVNFATSSAKQSTKLLGLGWWWLVVLAAALGFFWFLIGARRRNKDEDEA